MVLGPVDEGDLDRGPAQRPGGEQPGEPAPDDHHMAPCLLLCLLIHGPPVTRSAGRPRGCPRGPLAGRSHPAGSSHTSRLGSSRSASVGPQVALG